MPGKLQAITLLPKPSRQRYIWWLTTHILTLLVTIFAPMILWQKFLLLLSLALYAVYSHRHAQRTHARHLLMARIQPDGRSRLSMGDGRKLMGKIRMDSVITPWVILLRFDLRQGWYHPTMVLFSDALPHEQMRQLRVFLKYGEFDQEDW